MVLWIGNVLFCLPVFKSCVLKNEMGDNEMSDYHDYYENLAFPPQEIKSQDDLNKQGRESDVLVSAIEKCEKLEKQLKIAESWLRECKDIIEWYKDDTGYIDLPTENLLTRINAVIGESEE